MSRFLKNKIILLVLLIVVLAGIAGYIYLPSASQNKQRIGKVTREPLVQRVTIAGVAEPIRSTVVAAPYDGYIKKIYVKLGQLVKAGEPLVSITQSLQATENVFPIRAPFIGTVTQIIKMEGQLAKQNDPKEFIMRVDDLTKMFINANAPEVDVVKIKSGFEAEIKVSAILSKNYKGIVRDISQAATPKEQWGGRSQVEYLIKIEIMDADEALKPGMTAVIDIITNKKESVLTLPHEFIHREDDQYFVILKNGQRKNIKIGLQNETAFEVAEGLGENEEVQQVDFLKLIESQK